MFCPSKSKINQQAGFTLVEMIVVIAIMMIMTGVILANLPAFRSKTELDLVAQEVAITIRQAQMYGASSRAGSAYQKYQAYGIHLDATPQSQFILFGDIDSDNHYDVPGGSTCNNECVELFSFRGGVNIPKVRYYSSGGGWQDLTGGTALNLVIKRPSYEISFFNDASGALLPASRIELAIRKNNDQRYVCVWNTGHIYASKTTCP